MFKAYLDSVKQLHPKYRDYAKDVTNYILGSIEKGLPLYAVHGHCTDGGTAGSMIRYSIPEAAIIPLDYWLLNDPIAMPILQKLPWVGIVDLEPFNFHTIDFWVDHHVSAVGKNVKAEKIRFDADGDSGSWQLLLSSFLGEMPDHLVELAVMTRTTDTAEYITSPPIKHINKLTDLDLHHLEGKEGRMEEEQRIWLLDDAWGSTFSFKEHLQMYNHMAKDGFYGLTKVLTKVNLLRNKRKVAIETANQMSIDADVIIFTFEENSLDKFTLQRRLQERGAKVVISISKSNTVARLSLRRNRSLSEELNSKIKLNELAMQMNGGGHEGASGAIMSSISEALDIISAWSKRLNLTQIMHEIN
ncbi:MAG: hypothetical protein ACXAD7_19230 [Candidatus Kariarchaeaceae archaeon]|jgi:oligoribonuclease NrnB/cAMP/cGMP phosphodiesterase (DHH superfamily)